MNYKKKTVAIRSLFFSYIWRVKNRWYISIFILALMVLGNVASKQQCAIPNQEIVLQFTSESVSSEDALSAIAIVKEQLENAGIGEIQVQELQEGQLKISYYSATDVASIKALLSQDDTLHLGYLSHDNQNNEVPSEDNNLNYNLDVYEIQQGYDLSDFDGKLALETKAENDRFFNPHVFTPSATFHLESKERIEQVAFNFRRDIAIAIDKHSCKIPEVRAGPSVLGMYLI